MGIEINFTNYNIPPQYQILLLRDLTVMQCSLLELLCCISFNTHITCYQLTMFIVIHDHTIIASSHLLYVIKNNNGTVRNTEHDIVCIQLTMGQRCICCTIIIG